MFVNTSIPLNDWTDAEPFEYSTLNHASEGASTPSDWEIQRRLESEVFKMGDITKYHPPIQVSWMQKLLWRVHSKIPAIQSESTPASQPKARKRKAKKVKNLSTKDAIPEIRSENWKLHWHHLKEQHLIASEHGDVAATYELALMIQKHQAVITWWEALTRFDLPLVEKLKVLIGLNSARAAVACHLLEAAIHSFHAPAVRAWIYYQMPAEPLRQLVTHLAETRSRSAPEFFAEVCPLVNQWLIRGR